MRKKRYRTGNMYADSDNLYNEYKKLEEKCESLYGANLSLIKENQQLKHENELLQVKVGTQYEQSLSENDESVGTQNYNDGVDILKKWIIINEKEALYWKEKYLDRWMLEDAIESSKIKEKKHE